MKHLIAVILLASAASATCYGQTWNQIGDPIYGSAQFEFFPSSMDVSDNGSRMVLGSPGATPEFVRVYENQSGSWVQLGSDVSGTFANSSHGVQVSISGDGQTIACTAILSSENGTNSGHVRVLEWNGTDWIQKGSTIAGPGGTALGSDVSLNEDGSVFAVSTAGDDTAGNNRGKTEIFAFDGLDWAIAGSPIYGEGDGDFSGDVLSLSDDGQTVAIGAPNNDGGGSNAGHIRVYTFDGMNWSQLGSDIDGTFSGGNFGDAVAISGDGLRLIGGAPNAHAPSDNEGTARVYEFTAGDWVQIGPDFNGSQTDVELGTSVGINTDGSRIAIGASDPNNQTALLGTVFTYEYDGANWNLVDAAITRGTSTSSFGSTLALSGDGNTLVVADNADSEIESFSGAAYGFELGAAPAILPDENPLPDVLSVCSIASLTAPTATLPDGSSLAATTDIPFPISTLGTTEVTWTYDDGIGNTLTQVQDVIISLSEAPVPDAASLEDIVDECSIESYAPPTATDDCDGSIEGVPDIAFPLTVFGTTTVTWTFTDSQGNSTTQQQNLTVNNYSGPLPLIVPDVPLLPLYTEECQATITDPPTATTACGASLIGEPTMPFPITDMNVVTWVYTDQEGNTLTQVQSLAILNGVPPVPDLPVLPDVMHTCEVDALMPPTATDDCSQNVLVTNDAVFPITENTTVTWTYRDLQNNPSSQTQEVIIDNNIPPLEWTEITDEVTDNDNLLINTRIAMNAAGDTLVSIGGTVYTYAESGSGWAEIATPLSESNPGEIFGRSGSLNAAGNVLAIGSGGNGGLVRIYHLVGSDWILQETLPGQSSIDDFGFRVVLNGDGDRLAVYSVGNNTASPITPYVEVYEDTGFGWILLGSRQEMEGFGIFHDLSADGNRLALGAPRYETPSGDTLAGLVRVFEFVTGDWNQIGTDFTGDEPYARYGSSVDLNADGSSLAVGSPRFESPVRDRGKVRVYDWNGVGYEQIGQTIVGENAQDFAGFDLALSDDGNRLAVGELGFNGAFISAGKVRGFQRYNGLWVEHLNEVQGDGNIDDFGSELSTNADGSLMAVVSRHDPGTTNNAGDIQFYRLTEVPSPCAPATGCLGDFNEDGIISTADLLLVIGEFGCLSMCSWDLNDDDMVGTADILVILGLFGSSCE